MGLFRNIARAYLYNRMLRDRRPRGHARTRYGYGRGRRHRGGFFGPFPYYSTRTRGGSRVTVSGCCLPIPLAMALATVAGCGRLLRRR